MSRNSVFFLNYFHLRCTPIYSEICSVNTLMNAEMFSGQKESCNKLLVDSSQEFIPNVNELSNGIQRYFGKAQNNL